jgi:hypothetical protein
MTRHSFVFALSLFGMPSSLAIGTAYAADPATAAPADGTKDDADAAPAEKKADAVAPEAAAGSTPTHTDASLRTFGGGHCLTEPAGKEQQIGALGALLIPQLVSAGIDAATNALDAAGKDHSEVRSANIPLENAVSCVVIARDVVRTSREFQDAGSEHASQQALKNAPLLVELFLRQSRDGSALLVTPTMFNYRQTLEGKTSKSKRDIYLTITFAGIGGDRSSTITVPLGNFATRQESYFLDPIKGPYDATGLSPLGAANSVWIPTPFHKPTVTPTSSGASTALEGGVVADGVAVGVGAPGAAGVTVDKGKPPVKAPVAPGGGGGGEYAPKKPPAALPGKGAKAGKAAKPAVPVLVAPPATPEAPTFEAGAPVAPYSMAVAITEVRKGSPFARSLSGVIKGSKSGVVDLVDPTKRDAARQAEATAADAKLAAWVTARKAYATAYQAYCDEDVTKRASKAPDLYVAQMSLLTAANAAGQTPPFTAVVNPETGAAEAGFCP